MDYKKEYNRWLNNVSDIDKAELKVISEDEKEIAERFSLPLAFGTAGMRGILGIGTYRMNTYTVKRATLGLALFLISEGQKACNDGVVISYDTRIKSFEFALCTARVLAENGIKVYLYKEVHPVPMCSFAIGFYKAAAGVMITASHNPKEYNGYKVYGADGAQLSPENTAKVVKYIYELDYFNIKEAKVSSTVKDKIATMSQIHPLINIIGDEVDNAYYDAIQSLSLAPALETYRDKFSVMYTPLHGTGKVPVDQILKRINVDHYFVAEQSDYDGNFPTVTMPNPENPDALKIAIEIAKRDKMPLVIGTDPDADRMGVAVPNDDGEFVLLNGNQIGALLADYILCRRTELGTMPEKPAIVKTIVTTSLAKKIAATYGAECIDVLTGFKFIGEKINQWAVNHEHSFLFGYEESYGYLAGTHAKDKDAVVSAMLFSEMAIYLLSKGQTVYGHLQELYKKHGYYAEKSQATLFSGLDGMKEMADRMSALGQKKITEFAGIPIDHIDNLNTSIRTFSDGHEEMIDLPKSNVYYYALSSGDWVCARPSGTEPKLKVYVSACGNSMEEANKKASTLIAALTKILME